MAPPARKKAIAAPAARQQPKEVVLARDAEAAKAKVLLPSTERALVLRNGKHGAMGTGELVPHYKMGGNEKLMLLAEDAMEKRERERRDFWRDQMNMLRAPFNLETAKRIAQSQMDSMIDLINGLHDPELCPEIFEKEMRSHIPAAKKSDKDYNYLADSTWVAREFGSLVHNTYMLASAWALLHDSMVELDELKLLDRTVLHQLKSNDRMREIFLSAYDLVKKVVSLEQQRLRVIVSNTAHYSEYFRVEESGAKESTVGFNSTEVRKIYKSFLDSAILELCLPGSKFSPQALYTCLKLIEEESPAELKRCPQEMWDAVGDMAEAVRLLDLMESALIKEDGTLWTAENHINSYEFAKWEEAEAYSIAATQNVMPFVNLVNPTTNLRNSAMLRTIWERIDNNYKALTKNDIDTLWRVKDLRERLPHWSTYSLPLLEDGNGKLVKRSNGQPVKRTLALPSVEEEEDSDQPPGLLDVSDSENEIFMTSSSEEDQDEDQYDEESEESDFDLDEDEELRQLQRQAMDFLAANPTAFDEKSTGDKYAEERKSNPFLKLLSNLRGRMFKNESVLKTDGVPSPDQVKPSEKPVVEEGDGEKKKKKKKKPKKKKKKATSTEAGPEAGEADGEDDGEGDSDEEDGKEAAPPETPAKESTVASPVVQSPVEPPPNSPPPTSASSKKKKKKSGSSTASAAAGTPTSPQKPPSIAPSQTSTAVPPYMSTTSLLSTAQEHVISARKYLQKEGLAEQKEKVKTRPDQPTPQPEKRRFFSGLRAKVKEQEKEVAEESKKRSSTSLFRHLRKRTQSHVRKLFGFTAQDKKGALKWEEFLQIMRELGFEYDPSTAGSSVRFDPPDPRDRSITFHKPHPDPTLQWHHLKDFRKKLISYYGWRAEEFERALDGCGSSDSEVD